MLWTSSALESHTAAHLLAGWYRIRVVLRLYQAGLKIARIFDRIF